jgi:hypothetical protein
MALGSVRAIHQPVDPLSPIPRHPPVHCLAAYPIPLRHLDHWNPGQDFQHRPVPLLGHIQLPQHERECQASSEAKVSSIKRDSTCLAPGLLQETCDNFLHRFKGTPAARRASPATAGLVQQAR